MKSSFILMWVGIVSFLWLAVSEKSGGQGELIAVLCMLTGFILRELEFQRPPSS